MGVHWLNAPQWLIQPRPGYSGPRCSRSAEHASPVPANKQFFDRPARAAPDVGHHRVQPQFSAQYRQSQRCRDLSDVGGEIGVHGFVCRVWPATANAQHRSFRCAATMPGRLSWDEFDRRAFSVDPHPRQMLPALRYLPHPCGRELPPGRGKELNKPASYWNFTFGASLASGAAVKLSLAFTSL